MTKGEAITKMYNGAILTHPKLIEVLGARWVYITAGIRDHRGTFREDIWDHPELLDNWELYPDQDIILNHTFNTGKLFR